MAKYSLYSLSNFLCTIFFSLFLFRTVCLTKDFSPYEDCLFYQCCKNLSPSQKQTSTVPILLRPNPKLYWEIVSWTRFPKIWYNLRTFSLIASCFSLRTFQHLLIWCCWFFPCFFSLQHLPLLISANIFFQPLKTNLDSNRLSLFNPVDICLTET